MTTPMKPTATAAQRRGPTASFRMKKDRMVAKMGAVKLRVVASARGSRVRVWKRHRMETTPRALRPAWAQGRRVVRPARPPGWVSTQARTTGRPKKAR